GDLQLFVHRSAVARAGQRIMNCQYLQLLALYAGAVGEDEGQYAGHGVGHEKGDHLVVAVKYAAGHPDGMTDQAGENQQAGNYRFAGGDHEEVEEDQWIDPEQAIDPEIDGDQGGAYGKYAGKIK